MFLLVQITVETGQIGRQASGSVIVRDGETVSNGETNTFMFASFHVMLWFVKTVNFPKKITYIMKCKYMSVL